uniref:(northern house mosquito) hypothetical protein n=1 Tax=Culex pipiens TaxID=7175 RepID=A0A8D8FT04_CULPI
MSLHRRQTSRIRSSTFADKFRNTSVHTPSASSGRSAAVLLTVLGPGTNEWSPRRHASQNQKMPQSALASLTPVTAAQCAWTVWPQGPLQGTPMVPSFSERDWPQISQDSISFRGFRG